MKTPTPVAEQRRVTTAESRQVLVWRVFLISCLAVIALLAWMPGNQLPFSTASDKLNHLLAFAALGFLAWRAYPTQRVPALIALVAFGVLIELVQWRLPTRSAEFADLAADVIGLALGSLASRWTLRWA
jgi:VanZ family protein